MNKIIFLICGFLWCSVLYASESNINFRIQLLIADDVLVGEILKVEKASTNDIWGQYYVTLRTEDNTYRLLLLNPNPPQIKVNHEDQIILVDRSETPEVSPSVILENPVLGVYKGYKSTTRSIPEILEHARAKGNEFISNTKKCTFSYKRKIKNLSGSKLQSSIDYFFKHRPVTREQFLCLVHEIKSKEELSEFSFEPPFGNSWEGNYFPSFNTTGELIAYILPPLMNISITTSDSVLSDKDRKKLTEAWLYWGAVKFDQAAKQK